MQFAQTGLLTLVFWYDVSTPDGHEFILVNTEAGTRDRAFDHEALARAISQATDSSYSAMNLPFSSF